MPYALSPLAKELKNLEQQGDYLTLIKTLKEQLQQNKRTFADPYVKEWIGKRWRNLFIQAAVQDKQAVKVATKKLSIGRRLRKYIRKLILGHKFVVFVGHLEQVNLFLVKDFHLIK